MISNLLLVSALVLSPGIPPTDQTSTQTPATTAQNEQSPTTQGDQTQSEKKDEKNLKPAKHHEEIVVTAGRYEQESYQTPVAISVISANDLERRHPEKMVDALKQLAGIEISGEGPFRGLPVIRGMSSNRVLILVDGQRLNNARESTQYAGIQPSLVDLSQVERIEVLRGPASVLYGSDAIGGVINIITKQQPFAQGPLTLDGGLNYEYGSAASAQRGRFEVNGASERTTFHLGGSYFKAENYESPRGEVPNSGMKQRTFDGNVRFLVSEYSVLRFDAQSTQTRDVGFPGYDPKTSGIDIVFPKFDRNKFATTFESGPFAGLAGLSLSAYYQGVVKESRRNLNVPGYYSNNFTRSEINSYGINAQSSATFARQHVTFGLDFYQDALHDDTVSQSTYSPKSYNVQVPDSDQRGYGVFVQDEILVSERLHVGAGVRGDRFSFISNKDPRYKGAPFDVNESALSGNLSARYSATDHVALTALIGRGFRAPNIQERAYFGVATDGTTYIEQNPNLKSETSLNYEAGFKIRYPEYTGGFTVFHNSLNDFIGLVITGKDPRTHMDLAQFRNINKATIYGAEFDLSRTIGTQWIVFGNLSYSRGRDETTKEPLPLIPPFKATAGVRYQLTNWWSEFGLRAVAQNARVAKGFKETPGFTVYDIRAGYQFAFGLTAQAAIENFTNKAYHEPFNTRYEIGRNYRLSLGYRF